MHRLSCLDSHHLIATCALHVLGPVAASRFCMGAVSTGQDGHFVPEKDPYPKCTRVGPLCSPPFHAPLTHKRVRVHPFFFLHLTNPLFPLTTTWATFHTQHQQSTIAANWEGVFD
jgi:hypothetical protein